MGRSRSSSDRPTGPSDTAPSLQLRLGPVNGHLPAVKARMALALFNKGLPLVVARGWGLPSMLRGEDDVGIVPDDVPAEFPVQGIPRADLDRMFALAHLELLQLGPFPLDKVHWYPLPRLRPRR